MRTSYITLRQTVEQLGADNIISHDEKEKVIGEIFSDKQDARYILNHSNPDRIRRPFSTRAADCCDPRFAALPGDLFLARGS